MKKTIIISLTVIVLMIAGAVYYVFNKPARKAAGEDAAFSVTAEQLLKEYEASDTLANRKFLDKVIEMNGKITNIKIDQKGGMVLMLDEKEGMGGIVCSIDEGSKEKAKSLKAGQTISLKGICTGGDAMFGVTLNKCEVLLGDNE
jgi:predicted LPLAT superfamily acyltransferase